VSFQQVYSINCQTAMREHALQHPHLHGPMHVCSFSVHYFSLQGSLLTHDLCCFPQGRPLEPRVYVPQEVWVIVCIHLLNLHIHMGRLEQGCRECRVAVQHLETQHGMLNALCCCSD
jgi:hypothetical protein